VFSFMSGTFHPYYTVALAPAISALVGIVTWQLWKGRAYLMPRIVLAVMVAATGVWNYQLLNRNSSWHPELRWIILLASGCVAAALIANLSRIRVAGTVIIAGLIGAMLAGPAAYAVATAGQAHSGSIPTSGPAGSSGGMGGMGGGQRSNTAGGTMPEGANGERPNRDNQSSGSTGTDAQGNQQSMPGQDAESGSTGSQTTPGGTGGMGGMGGEMGGSNSELTKLLAATNTRWAAAISGATSAAELELASGKAVIALGGWQGSDPSPTLAEFQKYVSSGQIRYLISGGQGGRGGGTGADATQTSKITTWVQENFQSSTVGNSTVYDLTQKKTSS
jgi:hypothetical protein